MPTKEEAAQIYVHENVFSRPREYPNRALRLSSLLEPLWFKYGRDPRFVANLCLRYASHRNGASVLDVGCSTGWLLSTFRELEPSTSITGIDIDPNSKASAMRGIGDAITIGDLRNAAFSQKFDIITMSTIIEHLVDVVPYVQHAVDLLNDDGILFISTPDIGSARAKREGSNWYLINDVTQKIGHILWFDHVSMRAFAKQLDLEVVYLGNRGEAFWHYPKWLQTAMLKILGAEPYKGRVIRWYVPRLAYSIVADGLLSERFGWGDVLYTALRKRRR